MSWYHILKTTEPSIYLFYHFFLGIFMQDDYGIFYESMLQLFTSALTFHIVTQYSFSVCVCKRGSLSIEKGLATDQKPLLGYFDSCTYSVIRKANTLCQKKNTTIKNGTQVWTLVKAACTPFRNWGESDICWEKNALHPRRIVASRLVTCYFRQFFVRYRSHTLLC